MNSIEILFDKIVQFINTMNKWVLFIVCIGLVLMLGAGDYSSGFEFSFSLFYLVPISISAWFINRNSSLFVAALSAMVWYISNDLAGQSYTHPFIGFWNTSIRFGFFSIISLLLVYLNKSMQHERDLSRTDFLTGITSSRTFSDLTSIEILKAKRYGRPFSMAYIDLDNFKQINDRLGHSVGDKVLKLVAVTIQSNLRQTDFVARLGGDEFAVFLPETDHKATEIILNKVRSLLLDCMNANNWEVTFSIGVISFHGFSLTLDEVIRKADELMYSVKENGKNNIKFAVESPP